MKHWENAGIKAVFGRPESHASEASEHCGTNMGWKKTFSTEKAAAVRRFHESFPEYAPTPLVSLDSLAELLGVRSIHVKDESKRFGLNAFKVLGGSYCIGNYVAKKLGVDMEKLTLEYLISPEVKEKLGRLTFITATDGNHGRGIAWTANRLGQDCVVLMPKGSAAERLENIRALGANAWITDVNYDDTVRLARKLAEENGWVLVQDTAWEGYEKIPTWIMQGYMTMGCEIAEQLRDEKGMDQDVSAVWNEKTKNQDVSAVRNEKKENQDVSAVQHENGQEPDTIQAPTHIFLQAGVGAMAGAMAGFFADCYDGQKPPVITIVEPNKADCFYQTAFADDGQLHAVTGALDSIMAGLCCGEVCKSAWDVLKERADCYISMPDEIAARGMRMLGAPIGNDERIISGESGASSFGFAAALLLDTELQELKNMLGINENSRILCISTEGATDLKGYQHVVWDGWYPNA